MNQRHCPSVLSIAGFDGSGGAGIQADIKTISALGCYATSVLTALPVQNTCGVRSVHPIPLRVVEEQLQAIFDDIPPQAIKIGMIHTAELAEAVAKILRLYPEIPVVFDPVMVATSGHQLTGEAAIAAFVRELFPLATLITPNMDEAAILAGMPVRSVEDMAAAGAHILDLGCRNLLMKGGHLQQKMLHSVLHEQNGSSSTFLYPRVDTGNTHGAGCTLSSAIASFLALGHTVYDAVAQGQDYVHAAIQSAKDLRIGRGHGPLNHFHEPCKLISYEMV